MKESVSLDEQETILNIVPAQISKRMSIYTCIPPDIRYCRKLADDHPEDVIVIKEDDYGIEIEVPASWYRRPKPPAKKSLTADQRADLAARLAEARKKRKGGANDDGSGE